MQPTVLITVEDNESVLAGQAHDLTQQGFDVYKVSSEDQALTLTRDLRPDLIMIDLMLQGEKSGIGVCETIRREDRDALIMMIAPKNAQGEDEIKGFEAGANDCVTAPFGTKSLVARINAKFKRNPFSPGTRGKILTAGDLELDTKNYTARNKKKFLYLRSMEFKLLAALASRSGELKYREELVREVWEHHADVHLSRTLDVHIRSIRKALASESDYEYIHTVRGLGYRFEVQTRS